MNRLTLILIILLFLAPIILFAFQNTSPAVTQAAFRQLFNGKDLTGWVNVNTDKDTWRVQDGDLVCSGKPIGVMRSDRQYENFVLHIEWEHLEAGGNSGVFVWSDAKPQESRLPNGVEVQMLELDWVNLNKVRGRDATNRLCSRGTLRGRWSAHRS